MISIGSTFAKFCEAPIGQGEIMKRREELERLIYRILTTEEKEIDCGQAAELIAQYVELELAGEDVTRLLPQVAQHLRQCDDCFELHEVLHEIAALEQGGMLPSVDELLEEILGGGNEAQVKHSSLGRDEGLLNPFPGGKG